MLKQLFAALCCGSIFSACAAPGPILRDSAGRPVPYAGGAGTGFVQMPANDREPARELRGTWISTVENLDFAPHGSAESFRRDFKRLLDQLQAQHINAVFFQIRPQNDAFYPSRFNPWSRNLTGREGVAIPGFDPLRFMIDECRRRRIEFHAWLNPYRVTNRNKLSKSAYLRTLDPNNFARRNPHLVLEAPGENGNRILFLNPGEPRVIRHIADTVAEILNNYPVDAIHFDDYFYPYTPIGNVDAETMKRNNPARLSLENWRRANVNRLISQISNLIRRTEKLQQRRIRFGISPFGIWANRKSQPDGSLTRGKESYYAQYADTRRWVRAGYLDYIAPQIYWPFAHDKAPFAPLADWWAKQVRGTRTDLYIGLAPYRLGEAGAWQNPAEIANQLRYLRKHPEIKGAILFRARFFVTPANRIMQDGMRRIQTQVWTHNVPIR